MSAYIVGATEYPARRFSEAPAMNSLEQAADLALLALEDAGLSLKDVDGIAVRGVYVSQQFLPATVAEYLGVRITYGEAPDLGGAASAGMVWRAAAAIEREVASTILCLYPGNYPPSAPGNSAWADFGASSYLLGSPQAEFEIPYGHLGQNAPYAMIAQRYGHVHGYDPRAMARLVVQQRINACVNPQAIFHGQPLSDDDVLASPMIADPLHMLEIVRPVRGGTAVVVSSKDIAQRTRHRPVEVAGYGEGIATKSPQWGDMLDPPLREAAAKAFAMAGLTPAQMQGAQIYDCYTIAVLMALEAAGFCAKGEGMELLRTRDLTFAGDFPLNTNGGQLGYGQAGGAGGMTHVIEAYRQIAGRAGERQIKRCDTMFVSGNGGIMSEQVALILKGASA